MTELAPAKVNLALHLRRRRADGYHDLETLFAFTDFGDRLSAAAGDGLSLAIGGPMADAIAPAADQGDNLVLRAARALAAAAGIARPMAALLLDKHIPVAAGLGGGSADAAAALRLLSRFWHLDWPLERLAEVARPLGADVPACVFGATAFGTGRGDDLVAVDPGVAGTSVLLVNPRIAVPTPAVFAAWDGVDRGPLDTAAWRTGRNDLAAPAQQVQPVIVAVLGALTETEATFVRMSGSGATCLALYDSDAACTAAAVKIGLTQPQWWTAATRLR